MNIVDTCHLFEEKFNRLNSSLLVRSIEERDFQIAFDFRTNDLKSAAIVPEQDFIEAYVLNLRFFIQNNEPISIANMAKLYECNCSDAMLLAQFEEVRRTLDSELNSYCPFCFNTKPVSYRELFDGMIYAHFAHSRNGAKHSQFIEMKQDAFGYYLALDAFIRCLKMFHGNLAVINNLNKKAFLTRKSQICF